MKTGRVIGADELDARERARILVEDAEAKAAGIVAAAEATAERARARAAAAALPAAAPIAGEGRVDAVVGLVIHAALDGAALGEVIAIDRSGFAGPRSNAERCGESIDRGADRTPLPAEIVGFRGDQAIALPLGELAGVRAAAAVWRTGRAAELRCGDDLLGRVLGGTGAPIDGGPPLTGAPRPIAAAAPDPLTRPPITAALPTGVRALDALLSLGRGQRIGIFAAAGVGKSTLVGQLARGAASDVIVLCLVGERGRELGELLGDELAPALARTVAVCATSDAPPLVRVRAVEVATAIAESFRDRGRHVLLLVDSLTRVARAQREVGLSAGEPVARHGYPPSVFALLPRLIERAGATARGTITGIYAVLVAGDDHDEPIADEVRGLVDGHVVLSRRLAQRGQFPPIDVVASASRLAHRVIDERHAAAAARTRARLAVYDDHRDLVALGAYQAGRDPAVDDAVAAYPAIENLLRQRRDEVVAWDSALAELHRVAR